MTRSIRRQLRFLHAYAATTTIAFVLMAAAAFRQAPKTQNMGEITVERINVVDANGTLRLVISNSVVLSDAQGRARLALKVGADGAAAIEFLDADGKTLRRVTADDKPGGGP